jgi:hypothetical protein
MWFKAGSFSGLGTDAWLSNYAVGIGSTQFPTGTRLAAGNVQFTENDLAVVRNVNVTGVSTFQGNVDLGDDDRLRIGDGQDLQIFHNSSNNNSVIQETGNGSLIIAGNDVQIRNAGSNENKAKFITNGAVELYYDAVKKFETTGAGVTITGITSTTVLHASAGTYDAGQDTKTDSAIVYRYKN